MVGVGKPKPRGAKRRIIPPAQSDHSTFRLKEDAAPTVPAPPPEHVTPRAPKKTASKKGTYGTRYRYYVGPPPRIERVGHFKYTPPED